MLLYSKLYSRCSLEKTLSVACKHFGDWDIVSQQISKSLQIVHTSRRKKKDAFSFLMLLRYSWEHVNYYVTNSTSKTSSLVDIILPLVTEITSFMEDTVSSERMDSDIYEALTLTIRHLGIKPYFIILSCTKCVQKL
jgi:hypothetical protein